MSSASEGRIRTAGLVSEAIRIGRAAPVTSIVTVTIAAAVCAVTLATTGQTVAAEQAVLARIDDAGTRLVVAVDDNGTAGIDTNAFDRIAALSTVDWVIGLGFAEDGRNSQIGRAAQPVPTRDLWGTIPDVIEINGRQPRPGEGLAGQDAVATLGLIEPVGSVDRGDAQIAIVGEFTAQDPLSEFNRSILTTPDPETDKTLRSVYVLAKRPQDVAGLTMAIPALLGADDPTQIRLETSATLADVRAAVAGELGRFSRRLVLGAVGVGLLLAGFVVYTSVTLRRQDFGRRRALGATRGDIVALVATQYTMSALAGVGIGTTTGLYLVNRWTGAPPDWTFATAVATLILITTLIATIPPALIAAYRDPVHVLRVP